MINLLPMQQYVCKARMQQMKQWFYIGLLLTIAALLMLIFIYKINSSKIKQHIFDIQAQITQQSQAAIEANHLNKKTQIIGDKIHNIESTQNENKKLLRFLNELPQAVPEALYLVSLSWYEHIGIIYGQAHQQKTITHFLNELKNNHYFQHVNLIKSDKRHENDNTPLIYFVIEFHE